VALRRRHDSGEQQQTQHNLGGEEITSGKHDPKSPENFAEATGMYASFTTHLKTI
jgi:hypothetical protein